MNVMLLSNKFETKKLVTDLLLSVFSSSETFFNNSITLNTVFIGDSHIAIVFLVNTHSMIGQRKRSQNVFDKNWKYYELAQL